MTTHASSILDGGARENARRFRFLKLALLDELLLAEPSVAESYRALAALLRGRPADSVLDQGTTFFWKNVHRCVAESVSGGPSFKRYAGFVLRSAFDSFHAWMPDGFALSFPGDDEACLVMPALGRLVPVRGTPLTARRTSATSVEVLAGGATTHLDLADADDPTRLRAFDVPDAPGARLVLARDASLLDASYLGRLNPDIDHGEALSLLIGRSLALIRAADPQLGARLDRDTRWYFPIDSPDRMTHNSFSVKNLTGVIFLSAAYDDLRLAEAIVHELLHNELYLVQESERLAADVEGEIFYSPFRPDPRPLDGLFHALFVFTGVANFIARAEALPAMAAWGGSLRHRRCEIVRQLRVGLAQLPRERLTPVGAQIIDAVEADVTAHEADFGPLRGPLPEPLVLHLAAWRAKNADQRHVVRVPAGVELG